MLRAAPWVAFAKTNSRSSVNADVMSLSAPYPSSKATGTTKTSVGSLGLKLMASIKFFNKIGTLTLANLAPTMNSKAAATRHL